MTEQVILETNSNVKLKEKHEIRIRAWVRYFARITDITLFSWILNSIILYLNPSFINIDLFYRSILVVNSWIIVETISLGLFGTTIGKWIMNIQVRNKEGNKLNIRDSLRRSLLVWVYGYGCGVPIFNLITLTKCYDNLLENKLTTYDKKGEYSISCGNISIVRVIIVVVINIFIPFWDIIIDLKYLF
ncbi:hypothetical protein AN1V17_51370 [Vallitalea sediminicola]